MRWYRILGQATCLLGVLALFTAFAIFLWGASYELLVITGLVEPELHQLTGGRVPNFASFVKSRAGLKDSLECWSYKPPPPAILFIGPNSFVAKTRGNNIVVLCFDERIVESFSDSTLLFIVAHEIGHVVRGHLDLDFDGVAKVEQAEADAFALEFVSEGVLLEALTAVLGSPKRANARLNLAKPTCGRKINREVPNGTLFLGIRDYN